MSSARAASTKLVSIDDWIARESIRFSLGDNFDPAADRLMANLGDQVSLVGLGEALHGGDEFLILRNRLFQRLVEAHGFTAITLETHDPRARLVDAYIAGRGPASYEAIADDGFSYGSGRYDANRELVEWMKRYNADPTHATKLRFYGTLPSEQGETTESPRQALEHALAYLQSVDPAAANRHRGIIEPLLGANADWEDSAAVVQKELIAQVTSGSKASPRPAAASDGFGLSPRAQALRLAVEHLAFELHMRRPELASHSDRQSFDAALHDVSVARNLLAVHAALARRDSLDTLVSMRDAMAAEQLVEIAEQSPGKVLVHLHISHLMRTRTKLPWYEIWPTGAHLDQMLGARFAVIAGAVGISEENFIGAPEAGTVEARLLARRTDCFLPTSRGRALSHDELASLPIRTGSTQPFVPYSPLLPQSLAEVDAIAFLRSATHTRGAPPWPG